MAFKNFLSPRVEFSVEDIGEQTLNALKKFRLTSIDREENIFTFTSSLKNKSAIKKILGKKTHKTVDRLGFLAPVAFLSNRLTLVFLIVASICAFVTLNQFAFRVEVSGVDGDELAAIRSHLAARNIRPFTLKRNFSENLALELVETFPFVASSNIFLNGANAQIVIHRAENPVANLETPQDIICDFAGVITQIICLYGKPMVEKGDVVNIGDVLVTGARTTAFIKIQNGETVHEINKFI